MSEPTTGVAPVPPPRRSRPSASSGRWAAVDAVPQQQQQHRPLPPAAAAATPPASSRKPPEHTGIAGPAASTPRPPPLAGSYNTTTAPAHSRRGRSASESMTASLATDPVFALWRAEHPDATQAEVSTELRRRMMELRERDRVKNLEQMKRYYAEIHQLEQEQHMEMEQQQRDQPEPSSDGAMRSGTEAALSPDATAAMLSMTSFPADVPPQHTASGFRRAGSPFSPPAGLHPLLSGGFPADVNTGALSALPIDIRPRGVGLHTSESTLLLDSTASRLGSSAAQNPMLLSSVTAPPRFPLVSPRPPAQRCVVPTPDPAEYDNQRLAWDLLIAARSDKPADVDLPHLSVSSVFHHSTASVAAAAPPSALAILEQTPGVPLRDTTDVGLWVQGHWRHATHRHEVAATKIQCAVRRSIAQRRIHARRLQRRAAIEAVLQSEAHHEDTWIIAVATRDRLAQESASAERRVHLVRGFLDRVRAARERRRRAEARRVGSHNEVERYAATRIQAMVRGHLARQHAYLALHPEIAAQRLFEHRYFAAARIQAVMRRIWVQRSIQRQQRAACRIQTQYRRLLAKVFVERIRRSRRAGDDDSLRDYSAAVLQRYFRRLVARRYRRHREHLGPALLLQSVGRGWAVRCGGVARLASLRRETAAVSIQANVRRLLAKIESQRRRERIAQAVYEAQQDHASRVLARAFRRACRQRVLRSTWRQDAAAVEMQRLVRGHLGRKLANMRREDQQRLRHRSQTSDSGGRGSSPSAHQSSRDIPASLRQIDAAVMIQAVVRGFLVRVTSDVRVHGLEAERTARNLRRGGAAVVVQRFYREHIRRRRFAASLHRCARALTAFLRCVPAMRQVHRLKRDVASEVDRQRFNHAALLLQLWARVQTARRRADILRARRIREFRGVQRSEASSVLARSLRRYVAVCRYRRRVMQSRGDQQPGAVNAHVPPAALKPAQPQTEEVEL